LIYFSAGNGQAILGLIWKRDWGLVLAIVPELIWVGEIVCSAVIDWVYLWGVDKTSQRLGNEDRVLMDASLNAII